MLLVRRRSDEAGPISRGAREMEITERRRTERRPALENQAAFLWDEGTDVLESPARLIDISRDGASFVAEMSPPAGQEVCLRLEAPRRSGWVTARVVRSGGAMEGGLSFSGYFSQHLIDGLV
jgi:PilZ domain